MSSRHLRRLEAAVSGAGEVGSASGKKEIDCDPEPMTNSRQNVFSMLNAFEDGDDPGSGNSDDEKKTEPPAEATPQPLPKKTRRKKKGKHRGQQASKDASEAGSCPEDEVEVSLREVDEMLKNARLDGGAHVRDVSQGRSDARHVLKVNFRLLNAESEMRRKFGIGSNRPEGYHGRGRRPARLNTNLVNPKQDWPPCEKSKLSMEVLQSDRNCQYFKFVHPPEYQKLQFRFEDGQATGDPDVFVEILSHDDPYHVDTLLQLAELRLFTEDVGNATELVEKAVFICQLAFHPAFSLTSGNSRLPFKFAENRSFYFALMRHIRFVGEKGGYQTALELCKVLFNLEPDNDPLALLLVMDYYALYAEEYEWVVAAFDHFTRDRSVDLLPNWRFSYALALYFLAKGETEGDRERPTMEEADEALKTAFYHFPGFLMRVLEKCHVKPVEEPGFSYFAQAHKTEPQPVAQMIHLYVARAHVLWKSTDVMQWLERNVSDYCKRPLVLKVPRAGNTFSKARGVKCLPLNVIRHIFVAGLHSAIPGFAVLAAAESSSGGIRGTDPFPPPDNVVSYKRPKHLERPDHRPEWQRRDTNRARIAQLFLESLRPDFAFGAGRTPRAMLDEAMNLVEQANGGVPPPAVDPVEDVDEPGGAVGGPIYAPERPSPGLLASMRDFLNSFNYGNIDDRNGDNDEVRHTNAEWDDGQEDESESD